MSESIVKSFIMFEVNLKMSSYSKKNARYSDKYEWFQCSTKIIKNIYLFLSLP